MKTENRAFSKEAAKIWEAYAYVDNMSLEAWIWEFIRRSRDYRHFFDKFKKLSLCENVSFENLKNLIPECEGIPLSVPGIMRTPGDFTISQHEFNTTQMVVVCATFGEGKIFFALPDYLIPYNDFIPYGSGRSAKHPVEISRLDPYNILEPSSWYMHGTIARYGDNDAGELLKYLGVDTEEGIKKSVYVRISTQAREGDLKQLLKDVKQYLSPKKLRVRDKKWKYYLIVYDLKEQHGYASNDIADILNSAFPKRHGEVYDETNIQYYYNQAIQLIDKGKYKEYLNY
jgi:hypothetical protein